MLLTPCKQRTWCAIDLGANRLGVVPSSRAGTGQKTMPTKPAIASTRVVVMANSQSVPALPLARSAGLLLQNDGDIAVSCKGHGHLVARTVACECDAVHTHSSVNKRDRRAD